jgi:putative FmdB family regulatory protein
MPTYEYRCVDCHHVWERTEPMAQHEEAARRGSAPPPCPECQSTRTEQAFSAFFAKTARKS